MKITQQKTNRKGIAMTEYLITLALVAIAAITIMGLFGQEIKIVTAKCVVALCGTGQPPSDVDPTTAATTANTTANFNTQSAQNTQNTQ